MKRLLFFLLLALPAFGQGAFYQLPVPLPNAVVRVCPILTANPCPSPSSIFSDSGLTVPIANPFPVGVTGNFGFFISPGQYLVQVGAPYNLNYVISLGGGGSTTPSFPVTVAGTVNSGGIPYFNSTTQESSSGALVANSPVLGGGPGAAPFTSGFLTTDGTTQLNIGPQDTVSNGILGLKGKTSGTATITAPAVAGTALNPMIFSNAISLLAQGSPTNPTIAMAGGGSINSVSNAVEIDQGGNPSQSLGGNVKNASSLGYCWTNTTNATTGTSDTCSWRSAAGVFAFGNATASNTSGQLKAAAYMSVGTTFTSNAGCTESALTGGATAGKFTVGQNTACTIVITMGNSATAPNGWACAANDQTAVPAVAIRQTASNATTASLLMTVATSDVVSFHCIGY